MTLEFALRPRFSLDQPATPRRRRLGLRLPALALPIAGYWLVMAGGTHVLLGVLAEDAPVTAAPAAEPAPRIESPSVAPVSNAPPSLAANASDPPPSLATNVSPPPPSGDVRPIVTPRPVPAALAPAFATARTTAVTRAPEPSPDFVPAPPRIMEPDAPEPRKREVAEAPVVRAPAGQEARTASLPSCESAAASANQSIDLGAGRGAPDLTRDAFAAVLENGAYLAGCAIPARTALEICAAVQDGNVVGVSVTSTPRDPAVAACVRRAVAGLRFPRNASLDVTRTRFEAAR